MDKSKKERKEYIFLQTETKQEKRKIKRKMEVVISTSKLNSYGSRVITEGVDCEQYKKNPIVLWMHARPYGMSKNEPLPIGKMTNIRIEGDRLLGNIEFDEKDEFAQKIKNKYDAGILNMVSAGLEVVEMTDREEMLLPGQTRMTISKSKLMEVSCVDIGANDDSLRLMKNDVIINAVDDIIPKLKEKKDNKIKEKNKMKEVLKVLNLQEDASEEMVVNAIKKLQEDNNTMQETMAKEKTERIEAMVENAVKEGKLSKEKKETFVQIGKTSGEKVLKSSLEALRKVEVPSINNMLNEQKKENEIEMSKQTWDRMDKEGTLIELKRKDRQTYDKLFKVKFDKQ